MLGYVAINKGAFIVKSKSVCIHVAPRLEFYKTFKFKNKLTFCYLIFFATLCNICKQIKSISHIFKVAS